jgi:ribosomal protein S17E
MSAVINSLMRDDSIYNKQLLIIDSKNRLIDETEKSFTNNFDISNRIVQLELLNSQSKKHKMKIEL